MKDETLHWATSTSVQTFLALVPCQVNGKTVPPGETQVMYDKDWGYVLRCTPQTHQQAFTLISIITYQSTSGRWNTKRRTILCIYHLLFYNNGGFFQSRKSAGVILSCQFYLHKNVNLFVHVFMCPCFLCGGETQVS